MFLFSLFRLSPSRALSISVAMAMYLAWAAAHAAWENPALIGVCLFVGAALPYYSKFSNKLEERVNARYAVVSLGRSARFLVQLVFNLVVFVIFAMAGVVPASGLAGLGGVLGAAALTTFASQGAQYLAIMLFNRGFGDLNRNVMLALSANIFATAAATVGLPVVKNAYLAGAITLGVIVFGIGLLSDIRARMAPRGGIGVFFGTFNPFHVTHLQLVRDALDQRGLERVIIHPTVVPKLHAQALARGEIEVVGMQQGMCVLGRTGKADPHVNYFPTGDRFFLPEARRAMIELAIAEAGLGDRVEVMWLPEVYRDQGFYGVMAAIRRRYPGLRLHGIHGSDLGGMWCRSIYDECGWIYPYPVVRRDGISATAIRRGAAGMTSTAVGEALQALRTGSAEVRVAGTRIVNDSTQLMLAGGL